MHPTPEECEVGELWNRDHQKPHGEQPSEELAISIDLAGLTRQDRGRAHGFEFDVFRCHGSAQNLLPSSCANDGNASAHVLTVTKSLPCITTRDVRDSPQAVRAQLTAESAVVSEPTPRFHVRERFLASSVSGNYPKTPWPTIAAIAHGGDLLRAHVQRFDQVQRSFCAGRSRTKKRQHQSKIPVQRRALLAQHGHGCSITGLPDEDARAGTLFDESQFIAR